jgi:anti-anti-sigma factor
MLIIDTIKNGGNLYLKQEIKEGINYIKIKGSIDAFNALSLQNRYDEIFPNNIPIIIDCSEISNISSSGVGLFVYASKSSRNVKIKGISPFGRKLFDILGYSNFVKYED